MTDDVELLPREVLTEVVVATKTKGLTAAVSKALSDAIFDGLERRGYVIAEAEDVVDPPDEHLRTLKYIRKCVRDTIDNSESARDISSLTKRLGDISKEIMGVEERNRADAKSSGAGSNSTNTTARKKTNGAATHPAGSPASGQIDI